MFGTIPDFQVLWQAFVDPLSEEEVALFIILLTLRFPIEAHSYVVIICIGVDAFNFRLLKVKPYHLANKFDFFCFCIMFKPIVGS